MSDLEKLRAENTALRAHVEELRGLLERDHQGCAVMGEFDSGCCMHCGGGHDSHTRECVLRIAITREVLP